MHKKYFTNQEFLTSLGIGLLMLCGSLIINFYAGSYATEKASNPVTDIVLDNIPVFDVGGVFVFGALILVGFITFLCIVEPKVAPFTIKSISLFVLLRSIFISLTHIGPATTAVPIDVFNAISKFAFSGDLFFSGHTGLPFLMALIFWHQKTLRLLFIATSITFGVVVLLGHLHYSIDVLGAFFITYTIFHLSQKFFKDDFKLLLEGLQEERK